MGQQEIIKYLEKQKEPKKTIQISKALKTNCCDALKRLREHGEVCFKKTKRGVNR